MASAHDDPPNCQNNIIYDSDPLCRAHFSESHTLYRWGSTIAADHHSGERARFNTAASTWQNTTNPDSPWHVHFDSTDGSNVNMLDMSGNTIGLARTPREDVFDHLYAFTTLALRHNMGDLPGDPTWYTGTGTPGSNQQDAWGLWMEAQGHIQMISHHTPPGHEGHSHQHTVSGTQERGSTTKRAPVAHEIQHACNPYQRTRLSC